MVGLGLGSCISMGFKIYSCTSPLFPIFVITLILIIHDGHAVYLILESCLKTLSVCPRDMNRLD